MAETMILALEKRYENFSLGRDLTVKQIETIEQLAAKHGFRWPASAASSGGNRGGDRER
jgi:predicted amino acid dehydrogenase